MLGVRQDQDALALLDVAHQRAAQMFQRARHQATHSRHFFLLIAEQRATASMALVSTFFYN
ncbi:hypothetical protein ACFSKM_15880 [Ancylobacter dichloromethanicus]